MYLVRNQYLIVLSGGKEPSRGYQDAGRAVVITRGRRATVFRDCVNLAIAANETQLSFNEAYMEGTLEKYSIFIIPYCLKSPQRRIRSLTLSGRGRHCKTCRVRRRTRRWPAGRSWCVSGGRGAGAGGAARHAAAASSAPDEPARGLTSHSTAQHSATTRPHPALFALALQIASSSQRTEIARAKRRLRTPCGLQCGNQEFIF